MAFRLYLQYRSLDRVARELKKNYPGMTRQTLARWRDEGTWDERAKEADAKAAQFSDLCRGLEGSILQDWIARREQFKRALDARGGELSSDDVFAQLKIDELILRITQRQRDSEQQVDKAALYMEALQLFVDYLTPRDQVALKAVSGHLEGFLDHLKAEREKAA